MKHISIGEVAIILGVHVETLRRWDRDGKLESVFRTAGGHRRYLLTDVLRVTGQPVLSDNNRKTVCYARVSSHDQKEDLKRQAARLQDYCGQQGWADSESILDLGSGLNYRKRGLQQLLKGLLSGAVGRLVLTYPDRLLRFGSELIFAICEQMQVEVVVLEQEPDHDTQSRLCADVIELMTVFCARLYGQRSHKNRKTRAA